MKYKPPYVYSFEKCKCGKEFLVERHLCGSNHTIGTHITCKDCLKTISEGYKKERPEAAKKIQEWLETK